MTWLEGDRGILDLESKVMSLTLCQFQVEAAMPGTELAQIFAQHRDLPGVLLQQNGQFLGMLSRQRFLEYLIYPQGSEPWLQQSLQVIYNYARVPTLVVTYRTPILTAARQALKRPPELQGEPLVVRTQEQAYYLLNVHELNVAYWQIRGLETQVRYERSQVQMIQSEKMAGLGRLVDGVAHEILDPVSFIWGNLTHVTAYSQQLLDLIAAYEAHQSPLPTEVIALQDEIELEYLRQDLPQAIASIRSGADRLKKLASSLQTFCHIDDVYPKPADLHESLDSILLLLKARLAGEIDIVRNYASLPPVPCYIGQLGQVFMNILANAVDALLNQAIRRQLANELNAGQGWGTFPVEDAKPQITITTLIRADATSPDLRWISICIADNGPGLPPAKWQQLMTSFSIQQRTAKETSLGLSYQIVTAKHGGQLKVRSPRVALDGSEQPGTEFEILLPFT